MEGDRQLPCRRRGGSGQSSQKRMRGRQSQPPGGCSPSGSIRPQSSPSPRAFTTVLLHLFAPFRHLDLDSLLLDHSRPPAVHLFAAFRIPDMTRYVICSETNPSAACLLLHSHLEPRGLSRVDSSIARKELCRGKLCSGLVTPQRSAQGIRG